MRSATTAERPTAPHAETPERTLDRLDSGGEGLSEAAASRRLERFGPNEIGADEGIDPLAVLVAQFRDGLVYLLAVAAGLSLAVGLAPGVEPAYTDAALIVAILLVNGLFGFVQDYRAERSIEALRALATPTATVIRAGERRRVDATALVPGDVIVVEAGDAVPADARLIEAQALEADESTLTGESSPVSKRVEPVDPDAVLAERASVIHTGTVVVRGRGRAVVVATGEATAVGRIAAGVRADPESPTPFQAEVDRLGRRIGLLVVGLIVVVVAVQALFTAAEPITVLLVGVTLAVAAVPEGLPAVVTLTLALGSRRLVERDALVRRLPAVESLGSVDVIVADKTGTMTENRMTVRRLHAGGRGYEIADGTVRHDGAAVDPADTALEALVTCGARCNDATRDPERETGFDGDPTEVALLVAAATAGVDVGGGDRIAEAPFDAERRRMSVVVGGEPPVAYTKGAPEAVLERCEYVLVDGERRPLTDADRAAIRETADEFAADALRVLGFARRTATDLADARTDGGLDPDAVERGLTFLGLQGMLDPPREGVREAIADCRRAGVRVVMVTGDATETARAIAERVGIDPEGALDGRAVASLSDADLRRAAEDVDVFARVDPEGKVRVLGALQAAGHTVAMTGDGVNDAPALRRADVGVAMGERGTDVARAASDVILRDDDFTTIRDAVAEGRGVFDNVRKFVNYLLSANAGEVLAVVVGLVIGAALFPERFAARSEALILTPVALLWINLVTDGLPALALGADPKAADVLDRPPRPPDEPVLHRRLLASVATIGVLLAAVGLVLFFEALVTTDSLVRARTRLFTFLVVAEVVRIQVIRARYDLSPLSNPWLVAAVVVTLALQALVLLTPAAGLFDVVAPTPAGWGRIGVAFVAFLGLNVAASAGLDRLLGGPR